MTVLRNCGLAVSGDARGPDCLLVLAVAMLSGCAANSPPLTVPMAAPAQWFAPLPAAMPTSVANASSSLPHNGSLTHLSQWWQQQNDPLLVELIDAAQVVSPSIITARSNILQAQARRDGSAAALLPIVGVAGNASRSKNPPTNGLGASAPVNLAQLALRTSWEIDLFGQNAAALNAEEERFSGTQARWHEARVTVAAEVAGDYYNLRACEKQLLVTAADANSRLQTSRLTAQLTQAGFAAPATAGLARASAAEGNSRMTQQTAECALIVKALSAMTALPEPDLRQKLALALPVPAQQGIASISSVPAEVLSQRPDVYRAARELAAASFDVGSAEAQRYPRLALNGSIAASKIGSGGFSQGYNTWSIGPLALTVPLFDGGAINANINAVKARYEEAVGKYRGTVRQAVREVEVALVNLQSTTDRQNDTNVAAEGYSASFEGTQARYKAGLASLVELEDSRRVLLAAQSGLVSLERERRSAWIALYRALGGGWTTAAPTSLAMPITARTPAGAAQAALPVR